MNYKRVLKRSTGVKVQINVCLQIDHLRDIATYRLVGVYIKQPRKHKWELVLDPNNWEYRQLSLEGRDDFEMQTYLQHVTIQEIDETVEQLYENLHPTRNKTNYK